MPSPGCSRSPAGCTWETRNELGRAVRNWAGANGDLEIHAGERLVRRWLTIDRLTTATGTSDGGSRPYRSGYGVMEVNLNGLADPDERKVYFERGNYSTSHVFYESSFE